ncbi:MAG: HD domain-containing protein [Anaerolineales bacterium]|nr:HD domain-containing protein [Anaerolineales bacterium]
MDKERFDQQIQFILEIDKLKSVIRQSYLLDGTRRENTAEHSWHIALMGLLLAEYAEQPVDLLRTMKMLLIHDIIEIDAGDTYCYDESGVMNQSSRESAAAERLFGLLPEDQMEEFRELWAEFEERSTAEAKFAATIDRLMPLLHNFHTEGRSWREHGIRVNQVSSRNEVMKEGARPLWEFAMSLIDDAVERDYLE